MTTTTAKPRPLRLNQKAELVPPAQYARWHQIALGTAGLTKDEMTVLSAVAEYYRLLDLRGYASSPTIEEMALSSDVRPIDIRTAIKSLIGRALIAVRPGAGSRRNEYLLALPKRIAAALAPAADDVPPI